MAARWRILAGIVWGLISIRCGPTTATPSPTALTPTIAQAPCTAAPATPDPSARPTPTATPSAAPTSQATATSTAMLPSALHLAVERARDDLAERLDIPLDTVFLEVIVSDEFPVGNLGCPVEGAAPTPDARPALVSGWRLTLRVGDITYEYRARASDVVYCGPR